MQVYHDSKKVKINSREKKSSRAMISRFRRHIGKFLARDVSQERRSVELVGGRHDGRVIFVPFGREAASVFVERGDGGITLTEYRQRPGEPDKFDLKIESIVWHEYRGVVIEPLIPPISKSGGDREISFNERRGSR